MTHRPVEAVLFSSIPQVKPSLSATLLFFSIPNLMVYFFSLPASQTVTCHIGYSLATPTIG